MNPVGNPLANTSSELMLEVIEGLKSAGVKLKDMFVFERYKQEFIAAGMHKAVPDGVRWGGLTPEDDPSQLLIEWPGDDAVAGYDPDEFMTMDLVHNGHDPKDDRNLRSHLGLLVTRRVNKLVVLPVLKDHGSAGVTGALKNMSHGLVNNVARSHSYVRRQRLQPVHPPGGQPPDPPTEVRPADPGRDQGGLSSRARSAGTPSSPGNTTPSSSRPIRWRWTTSSGTSSTPSARRRTSPPSPRRGSGRSDPLGTEGFDVRQPQHIALAGNLGLGNFDYESALGRRHSIDHRVITVGDDVPSPRPPKED